jgi:hypothetical protein
LLGLLHDSRLFLMLLLRSAVATRPSLRSRCCHIHCAQLESGSGNRLMLGGLIQLTGEFNGRRMPRRDVDAIMPLSRGRTMQRKMIMHVCRECNGEGTEDVQLFVLALNSGGSQLRGFWHPACFKKVQRDIIDATRAWVLGGDEPKQPR